MIYRIINNIYALILETYIKFRYLNILQDDNSEKEKKETISLMDIEILHYSVNFLVVNKRYDVLINSNNPNDKVTVQTQLKVVVPELVNPRLGHDFNFVHRLDFATSGILCVATNKLSCRQAAKAFEKRLVDKYYLAIVRGLISQEMLNVDLGIGEDKSPGLKGVRMAVEGSSNVEKTRTAFTRILVLENGISHGYPATKVLLKPETGRRHQLRLHLNALGHTIVGDFTYSNRRDVEPYRMFLHAVRLVMPTSLEDFCVQTTDPFGEENPLNRWQSIKVLHALDEKAINLINEARSKIVITSKAKQQISEGRIDDNLMMDSSCVTKEN